MPIAPPMFARDDVLGSGVKYLPVCVTCRFELVDGDAGLRVYPSLPAVDLDDIVHVLREIKNYPAIDRLTGQPGSTASRKYRNTGLRACFDGCADIIRISWHNDAQRRYFVD